VAPEQINYQNKGTCMYICQAFSQPIPLARILQIIGGYICHKNGGILCAEL
jgi:hypothetical protein